MEGGEGGVCVNNLQRGSLGCISSCVWGGEGRGVNGGWGGGCMCEQSAAGKSGLY